MSGPPCDVGAGTSDAARPTSSIGVSCWNIKTQLLKEFGFAKLKSDSLFTNNEKLAHAINEFFECRRKHKNYGTRIIEDCLILLVSMQELYYLIETTVIARFKSQYPNFFNRIKIELLVIRKGINEEFRHIEKEAHLNQSAVELCINRVRAGDELNEQVNYTRLGQLICEIEKTVPGTETALWAVISRAMEQSRGAKVLWADRDGGDKDLSVLEFISKYYRPEIETGFFDLADLRRKDMKLSKAYENFIFNKRRDRKFEEAEEAAKLVPRARQPRTASVPETDRGLGGPDRDEARKASNRRRTQAWRARLRDDQPR